MCCMSWTARRRSRLARTRREVRSSPLATRPLPDKPHKTQRTTKSETHGALLSYSIRRLSRRIRTLRPSVTFFTVPSRYSSSRSGISIISIVSSLSSLDRLQRETRISCTVRTRILRSKTQSWKKVCSPARNHKSRGHSPLECPRDRAACIVGAAAWKTPTHLHSRQPNCHRSLAELEPLENVLNALR